VSSFSSKPAGKIQSNHEWTQTQHGKAATKGPTTDERRWNGHGFKRENDRINKMDRMLKWKWKLWRWARLGSLEHQRCEIFVEIKNQNKKIFLSPVRGGIFPFSSRAPKSIPTSIVYCIGGATPPRGMRGETGGGYADLRCSSALRI
jgi:hypothetical protein